MIKITRSVFYIFVGILFFGLLIYGFLKLIEVVQQGEFIKYDKGVTIEVINSSEHSVTDLRFFFSDGVMDKEIGTMKAIGTGQTSTLSSFDYFGEGGDVSLYMQYTLKKGQKKEESLLYIHGHNSKKVVVLVDITQLENNGTILFDTKGYDGLFITRFEIQ